jgi:hypothetical protein
MNFGKDDMQQTHYTWSSDLTEQRYSGDPTRRPFDKFNGPQVLFIINHCESLFEKFTRQEGRRLEYSISNLLPPEVKSEISVVNWLRNNL